MPHADAAAWGSVLILAVLVSVLGYIGWYWALARGGISRIASTQFTEPLFGVPLAVVLLGGRAGSAHARRRSRRPVRRLARLPGRAPQACHPRRGRKVSSARTSQDREGPSFAAASQAQSGLPAARFLQIQQPTSSMGYHSAGRFRDKRPANLHFSLVAQWIEHRFLRRAQRVRERGSSRVNRGNLARSQGC